MTFQETISQHLIRLFVHPISRNRPINFNTHLKKATRILIACPSSEKVTSHSKTISDFTHLFPRENLVVLFPDLESYSPEKHTIQLLIDHPLTFPNLKKQNLYHLLRAQSLKQLAEQPFDVLLDLDPDFSLLNAYLCRLLRPPLRISLSKPYSNAFYNLQYNGKANAPYAKRLERLLQFLKSLPS